MGINDISLTAGMRGSLLSMQGTSSTIDRTQERLATGRRVNSALDNPTNFFASQAHINRAVDLSGRMDSVKEAIQNIYAANSGTTAITSLLDAANGLANAALSTNNLGDRAAFSLQFDQLLDQIDTLAADSIYRGTNLLKSDSLTVNFSDATGTSTFTIAGVDATHTGLGVDKVNESTVTIDVANMIAAGDGFSLAINTDGTVSAWGDSLNPGVTDIPPGLTDVVSIKSGADFAIALKSDGTLVAWGDDTSGVVSGATGLTGIASISVGSSLIGAFALALKDDGTVVAWGSNFFGETTVPGGLTDVVAVAAGTATGTSLALKSDGTVVAWGDDGYHMITDAPTLSGITSIANGGYQAAAIKDDTSVVVWGTDDALGQASDMPVGLTGVTQVSAGRDFTLALKSDGTVVGWGEGITHGTIDLAIPAGLTGVLAISAGTDYAIALKDDGTVVGWGPGGTSGATDTQTGISVGGAWAANADIQTSQDQVADAMTTMRSNAKTLASNSSILTTRLDFTSFLTGILQAGADNLTLADMNEEGANMLMLQTRQQLGTSSLSMGAQAAQSVLRLF